MRATARPTAHVRGAARGAAAIVARAALLALAACSSSPPAAKPPPNVVLVLADTARADRMSLYGYERPTTPHLDARAASAVVFEAAHSQAPCTFPSVNSILTSRSPHHFFDQPLGDWSIPAAFPTVAEILRAHGYATFAVSASSVVRATPSKVNTVGGFAAGFDTFDERCRERPAWCVNERALTLARAARKPFFAYLHYMDPHHPYAAPRPYRNHFAQPIETSKRIASGDPQPILEAMYKRNERRDWSREVRFLSDSYDDEMRYLDAALDEMIAAMEALDPERGTLIVLAADHGEDFLEHGDLMHCRSLYETSLHVPLVLWIPGVAGTRVAGPVQNLDVVPTLLDLLGIDAAQAGLEGRSLRAAIGGDAIRTPAYAIHFTQRSILDGSDKLIYDLTTGSRRLYDLAGDPGETTELSSRETARAAALEQRVLERVAATEAGGDTARAARLSGQVEERLRTLGYIE